MLSNWNLGWFAKKRKEAMDSDDGLGRWTRTMESKAVMRFELDWTLHLEVAFGKRKHVLL
jgi:hypothetical protein